MQTFSPVLRVFLYGAGLLLILLVLAIGWMLSVVPALAATGEDGLRECSSNADCGHDGMYCAQRKCSEKGTCEPRPDFCTQEYDPVCGCDGQTYPNACYAARSGVNVKHEGPCRGRDP